jgi:DNA methylase
MQELFASGIKPNLCVTDPSCPENHLELYGELAKCCADANVPLVAVMCGQSYLPEVFSLMTQHLQYRWTLAYLTPSGQAAQVQDRKVNTSWKPVLLFGKATSDWIGDVVKSAVNDDGKEWHQWGQSTTGAVDLIKRLVGDADPGKLLVCDPFLGGGASAIACMELGLKFVGCDIEQKNVENTRLRLENL